MSKAAKSSSAHSVSMNQYVQLRWHLYSMTTPRGSNKSLGETADKVLQIVNMARRCGFTKQDTGLQTLNKTYTAKRLGILEFPCKGFRAQSQASTKKTRASIPNMLSRFKLFNKMHAKNGANKPSPRRTKLNIKAMLNKIQKNSSRSRMSTSSPGIKEASCLKTSSRRLKQHCRISRSVLIKAKHFDPPGHIQKKRQEF